MLELFRFELQRGRFGRRARSSGLKRGTSWSGSVAIMQHGKNFFRAFIEHFREIFDLVTVIPSLCVLESDKVFGNIRKPMSVFF